MGRARHKRYLLWAGVAAPVICFTTALLAPLAFPHFNWSTQYLSELGDPAAPHPWIFNGGVILGAIAGMAAGVGFFLALRDLTGRTVVPAIIGALIVIGSGAIAAATFFPWRDPRHQIVNLGLTIQIAPLLLLWLLHGDAALRKLRIFLGLELLVMVALTILTRHIVWPDLVNLDNVGWWERGFAAVLIGWIGVVAVAFDRHLLGMDER